MKKLKRIYSGAGIRFDGYTPRNSLVFRYWAYRSGIYNKRLLRRFHNSSVFGKPQSYLNDKYYSYVSSRGYDE